MHGSFHEPNGYRGNAAASTPAAEIIFALEFNFAVPDALKCSIFGSTCTQPAYCHTARSTIAVLENNTAL